MMDNFGFAPRRSDPQDFRGGENEMRAPMPRPPEGSRFDRGGPERGPFPGRDRMDQRPPQGGPRPEFGPGNPGDQRFGPGQHWGFDGPRPQFGRPSPDFRGPPPRREGPQRWGIPLAPQVTELPNGCIKDADRWSGLPDDLG